MTTIKHIALDIYEAPKCWTFRGNQYETLKAAHNAALRYLRKNAPNIGIISFHTQTKMGRIISDAISKGDAK